MPAPPPPPPMPPMGRGAGGPPPPPPMPGKAPGGKPPSGAGRGALLSDINKGARLKKVTQVNDRSAPIVGKVSDGPSGPPIGGAPPIPGMGRAPAPPSGLAPPVPGGRARSNSDTGGDGSRDSVASSTGAPQLAGLFAGGMPKLRKSGGVKTGAETSSPYLSDPETSRSSAPKPPRAAPRPPGVGPPAPPVPGGRPPPNPAISALRNNLRPSSMVSTHSMPDIGSKPKPPPPIGKKPPIPPPTSRKPSGFAPPPPASPARPPPVPGSIPSAPRPPPPSHTPSAPPPPPPSSIPSAPPPPPPSSAPRAPPARSTPPPPPTAPSRLQQQQDDDDDYDPYRYTSTPPKPPGAPAPKAPNGLGNALAAQAAKSAFGRSSPSAPPPPPPGSPPPSLPSAPAPPPPPSAAPSRPATQAPLRSMLDPSSYTLTNGGAPSIKSPTNPGLGMNGSGSRGKITPIHDLRWRFQDESQFPKPREFGGGQKRYRAGRGSSVPLDLGAYE